MRGGRHSKFEQARRLAASLAYLMIGQRDAVGLVTFDTAVRAMIPPRSSPGHFSVVCSALERTKTGGEARLSGILHALAERIRRRGLIVIVSDGFDDVEDLAAALRHLRHRRHEVLFFHTLAPEEEEFPFRRPGAVPQPGARRPRGPRRSRVLARRLPRAVQHLLRDPEGAAARHGGRLPAGLDRRAGRADPARLPVVAVAVAAGRLTA